MENAKEKAERFHEKMENMAESAASVFEDWLNSHPDASFEQKHEKLRDVMYSNAMMDHGNDIFDVRSKYDRFELCFGYRPSD